MIKHFLLLISVVMCVFKAYAQDPQYSQFYANALYLSPAFAGSEQNTRGIAAMRYQWPGLDVTYIYHTASVDHYFANYNSGVGIIVNSDYSTTSKLNSTEAGLIYSYQAALSKKVVFRPAVQISYVSRSINYNKLTFGSQYNDDGFKGGSTNENLSINKISYPDISTGGIFYSKKYWLGLSLHHLNRPDQSLMKGESRLPVKTSLIGGYKISFTPEWKKKNMNEEVSVTPTFIYKMQGKSDQFDVGIYGRYNSFIAGFWYRGIPVKVYKPERTNNDALVFMIGLVHYNFKIGYSYDYTISKLTMKSGGSHELTLSYAFKNNKRKKIQKRAVCPQFYKAPTPIF